MTASHCRYMCVVVLVVTAAALASAQITFSRDWSGGKRDASVARPHPLDCGHFARLCHRFIHDLKAAMEAERQILPGDEEVTTKDKQQTPAAYDDELTT